MVRCSGVDLLLLLLLVVVVVPTTSLAPPSTFLFHLPLTTTSTTSTTTTTTTLTASYPACETRGPGSCGGAGRNPFLRPSDPRLPPPAASSSSLSTTKDPLTDFCEVACKNGQGSVVCNCPGHIIGRRSVLRKGVSKAA